MDDRVLAAAENNARWCDLVCRSHGIPTATDAGWWVALRRAPALYPDAVTLRPRTTAEAVLGQVDIGPGCAVKDSFAALDLARQGFEEQFRARWIFREPSATATVRGPGPAWTIVDTDDKLSEWTQAAASEQDLGSDVLRHQSVRVLGARTADGFGAGAVANRTGSVVGVTNVFTTAIAAGDAWVGIADALATAFPALGLVGYAHGDSLRASRAAGFREIGALRVWQHAG